MDVRVRLGDREQQIQVPDHVVLLGVHRVRRSIIEYGAARCSAKWTTAPGSADHTSVAAACRHHAQNATRTLATLGPSPA